jgi:chorismate-pyruvate lyase
MQSDPLYLNKFGELILYTTSSMTRLIEILYNVELRAKLIQQQPMVDCPPLLRRYLQPSYSSPILRQICLTDTDTAQPYYYAETLFQKDHFHSKTVIHQLYHSDTPIGKIIDQYRLETYREILEYGRLQDKQIAHHLGVHADEWLLYKVSRMYHQSKDLFLICEYFPNEQLSDSTAETAV